jgi:hypothetical protein
VKRTKTVRSCAALPCQRLSTRPPKRTALSVFPGTGVTSFRTYPRMIPPARNDREAAMQAIARLPVCTRGSRSVCIELETASIPV